MKKIQIFKRTGTAWKTNDFIYQKIFVFIFKSSHTTVRRPVHSRVCDFFWNDIGRRIWRQLSIDIFANLQRRSVVKNVTENDLKTQTVETDD